jgi:hypothetical protein
MGCFRSGLAMMPKEEEGKRSRGDLCDQAGIMTSFRGILV